MKSLCQLVRRLLGVPVDRLWGMVACNQKLWIGTPEHLPHATQPKGDLQKGFGAVWPKSMLLAMTPTYVHIFQKNPDHGCTS